MPIFNDNFYNDGLQLDQTYFLGGWTVAGGTVDLIGAPDFYDLIPGNDRYVDLDGSSNQAGTLSRSLRLNAGKTYTATFQLAGNHSGAEADTVDVKFGTITKSFTLAATVEPTDYALNFTPATSGNYALSFHNRGGDNYGALLDNVSVAVADSFTGDGRVATDFFSGVDYGRSVAVLPDGKLLLAGDSFDTSNRFALARYNAGGSLDHGFSFDGRLGTVISGAVYDVRHVLDQVLSVTAQADGNILVAGTASLDGNLALARYLSNGSLDDSFDGDGMLTTYFAGGAAITTVARQPDDKILVAGFSGGNFALARYLADGTLDYSFDVSGSASADLGYYDIASGIALQSDGKILLAGNASMADGSVQRFALARFNQNGGLDTTFSADGTLTTDIGGGEDYAIAVTTQADGKILVAGYSSNGLNKDFAVARYNKNGSLDASFSQDGTVTTDFGIGDDLAYGIAVQPDGRILLAGTCNAIGNGGDFGLVRYNADGSLDSRFSADGMVSTDIHGYWDDAHSVALQPDGKILLAGTSFDGAHNDFALVRYNADGSLDTANRQTGVNRAGTAAADVLNGSAYHDTLSGAAGGDSLNGGAGADTLDGGGGDDLLVGGLGKDRLTGGPGADRFDFNAAAESGIIDSTRDVIADFHRSESDKIDLAAIDANSLAAGNQAFTFIGTAAFSTLNAGGQLRYDAATHVLSGSTDADNQAEFQIGVVGAAGLNGNDLVA
ncbi:MAG: DUF642 domain-containing protein [Methylococcaceae bacterium]|nr:MAG: DUF642 domain-containing protein [Methylococcaceae bacterium]